MEKSTYDSRLNARTCVKLRRENAKMRKCENELIRIAVEVDGLQGVLAHVPSCLLTGVYGYTEGCGVVEGCGPVDRWVYIYPPTSLPLLSYSY